MLFSIWHIRPPFLPPVVKLLHASQEQCLRMQQWCKHLCTKTGPLETQLKKTQLLQSCRLKKTWILRFRRIVFISQSHMCKFENVSISVPEVQTMVKCHCWAGGHYACRFEEGSSTSPPDEALLDPSRPDRRIWALQMFWVTTSCGGWDYGSYSPKCLG